MFTNNIIFFENHDTASLVPANDNPDWSKSSPLYLRFLLLTYHLIRSRYFASPSDNALKQCYLRAYRGLIQEVWTFVKNHPHFQG